MFWTIVVCLHNNLHFWIPAAGLQEIHNLKQDLFKLRKTHNDTLRDVSLLNATNNELNNQLDYCGDMLRKAGEDIAAFKTGDADDDKLPDCQDKLYQATHSLDRCAMANDYLNLKIEHQNQWKAEADEEVWWNNVRMKECGMLDKERVNVE